MLQADWFSFLPFSAAADADVDDDNGEESKVEEEEEKEEYLVALTLMVLGCSNPDPIATFFWLLFSSLMLALQVMRIITNKIKANKSVDDPEERKKNKKKLEQKN